MTAALWLRSPGCAVLGCHQLLVTQTSHGNHFMTLINGDGIF
jgi:hypothetical protein